LDPAAGLSRPDHTEEVDRPLASLADQVLAGALDDELPQLVTAINARMRELDRIRTERALARLRVGSRVVITGAVKPQYLRGHTGEVHMIEDDHVVVCLDRPVGKFADGHIDCPAAVLLPLET